MGQRALMGESLNERLALRELLTKIYMKPIQSLSSYPFRAAHEVPKSGEAHFNWLAEGKDNLMSKLRSAAVALMATAAAVSFTATADARKGGGHGPGGHIGANHWGGGHHHRHGWRGGGVGFGFYVPSYGYYDDWDDGDDCYRVKRYGRWRIVCR
jgi:hypothetical protein